MASTSFINQWLGNSEKCDRQKSSNFQIIVIRKSHTVLYIPTICSFFVILSLMLALYFLFLVRLYRSSVWFEYFLYIHTCTHTQEKAFSRPWWLYGKCLPIFHVSIIIHINTIWLAFVAMFIWYSDGQSIFLSS